MTLVRALITVSSFVCFIAWLVWFLKKDNHAYYQDRARELLDDDDTTPTVINSNTAG
ncbi:MAG: hypothetical protein ACRCV6_06375 [Formosimonas sp.]